MISISVEATIFRSGIRPGGFLPWGFDLCRVPQEVAQKEARTDRGKRRANQENGVEIHRRELRTDLPGGGIILT